MISCSFHAKYIFSDYEKYSSRKQCFQPIIQLFRSDVLNNELSLGIMGKSVVVENIAAVEVTQTVDVDLIRLQSKQYT